MSLLANNPVLQSIASTVETKVIDLSSLKTKQENLAKFYGLKVSNLSSLPYRKEERNKMLAEIESHFGLVSDARKLSFFELKVYHAQTMKDFETEKDLFFDDMYELYSIVKRPIRKNGILLNDDIIKAISYKAASFHLIKVSDTEFGITAATIQKNKTDYHYLVVEGSHSEEEIAEVAIKVEEFNSQFNENVRILTTDKFMYVVEDNTLLKVEIPTDLFIQYPSFSLPKKFDTKEELEQARQFKHLANNYKAHTRIANKKSTQIKKLKEGTLVLSNAEQLDKFGYIVANTVNS